MKSLLTILIFCSFQKLYSQDSLYNVAYSIACHNCYDPRYAKNIEDVFLYTKTIEIDIWDSYWLSGGWKAMNNNWYVKHDPRDKGNINCCGGTFRDCLERIKAWSDQNANHNVITVFIDKKENWSEPNETRKPNDLDNLLISIFTKEKIFTPALLLKDKGHLKEALANYNWPAFDSLKGKFIFVITNGTLITSRNPLNEYLTLQKNNSVCFVAPEITNENQIIQPEKFSQENALNVVFYNLQYQNKSLGEKINSLKYISRLYGSPETIESYTDLVKSKINFVALFNYKLLIKPD